MLQEHAGVKHELYGEVVGEAFENFGVDVLTDTKQPPSSFPAGTSLAPTTSDGMPISMVD